MNLSYLYARMRQLAPLAPVFLGAVIAVVAYLQALGYPFFSDDIKYTAANKKLIELPLTELWRVFTEPYNPFLEFFPLRDLSYWLDIALFGLNPAAFRMHSILLYLLCLPLVYGTTLNIWRYFRPDGTASAPWAAVAVTTLFALHPTHVEAVVWIAGRKEVLSCLFSLLALWLAVCARREQWLSAPYAVAAMVAFVAAMFSKTPYIAVAPIVALLWFIFWRGIPVQSRRYSMLLWPFAILFLAGLLLLFFLAKSTPTTIPPYFGIETVTRTLAILGWLARLVISPESRHFFYPVLDDPHLPVMVIIGSAVLAAAIGGMMSLRKRSLEGFALLAFLLLCMPYLQLIPYRPPSLVSDRFLTLAVWPAMLLIVALCWRLKPKFRTALLILIALPWCFQTIERPRDWRSPETLLDADLRAYPGYYMPAVYKIVGIQLNQGLHRSAIETANSITIPEFRNIMIGLIKADYAVANTKSTGNPQEAMTLLWELVLDIKQPPAQAKWNSPINILWDRRESILVTEWEYLAKYFPDDVLVHYYAGLSLFKFYKFEEAIANLRAATTSQYLPESMRGTAFYYLGLALMNSKHIAEAETPLSAALKQSPPKMEAYCLLSEVYKQYGRLDEATRAQAACLDRK